MTYKDDESFLDKYASNSGGSFADRFKRKTEDNEDNAGGFANRFKKTERPTAPESKETEKSPTDPSQTRKKIDQAKSKKNLSFLMRQKLDDMCKRVYLVRGKDKGRDAAHYVLIKKSKRDRVQKAFLAKIKGGGPINLEEFGSAFKSFWGHNPPEEFVQKLADSPEVVLAKYLQEEMEEYEGGEEDEGDEDSVGENNQSDNKDGK